MYSIITFRTEYICFIIQFIAWTQPNNIYLLYN